MDPTELELAVVVRRPRRRDRSAGTGACTTTGQDAAARGDTAEVGAEDGGTTHTDPEPESDPPTPTASPFGTDRAHPLPHRSPFSARTDAAPQHAADRGGETVDELARELAALTGESVAEAVAVALRERIDRQRGPTRGIAHRLSRLTEDVARLPTIDARDPETLLDHEVSSGQQR